MKNGIRLTTVFLQMLFFGSFPTPAPASPTKKCSATGTWRQAAKLVQRRRNHTITLLPDGSVLVIGGWGGNREFAHRLGTAERWSPTTKKWRRAGKLAQPRHGHTASLLRDGRVLVAGGIGSGRHRMLSSVEIWNPRTNRFKTITPMNHARSDHVAVTLKDGRVFVAGGLKGIHALKSAEVWHPKQGRWLDGGTMKDARVDLGITLLPDNRVLVSGGFCLQRLRSAEVWSPKSNTFTATGQMKLARDRHRADLLPDGRVIVSGGTAASTPIAAGDTSAEIWDPITGKWAISARMNVFRSLHATVVLLDGQVLALGGRCLGARCPSGGITRSVERWNPKTGRWHLEASMKTHRSEFGAVVLKTGRVLVVGGANEQTADNTASCELFDTRPSAP